MHVPHDLLAGYRRFRRERFLGEAVRYGPRLPRSVRAPVLRRRRTKALA